VHFLSQAVPLPVLASVVLFAAALLLWARHGRRVNEHPHCRKCGFDLFGRPAGSFICSECGADLRRNRAVRFGARRARRKVVAASLVVFLPSVAWLGLALWASVSQKPTALYKPVSWLVAEAAGNDAAARATAFAELSRRLARNELSGRQRGAVVERALALQADPQRPWDPAWGDLVEQAYAAGKLPADHWRRYVAQAPAFSLQVPDRVRRGEKAWLELFEQPTRVGRKGHFMLRVHRKLGFANDNGQAGEPPRTRDYGVVSYRVGATSRLTGGWSLPLNETILKGLPDGPQRARLTLVVEVYDVKDALRRRPDGPPIATRQIHLDADWSLEPAPSTAVTRRPAEEVRENPG
jgi:hypothetical protein